MNGIQKRRATYLEAPKLRKGRSGSQSWLDGCEQMSIQRRRKERLATLEGELKVSLGGSRQHSKPTRDKVEINSLSLFQFSFLFFNE